VDTATIRKHDVIHKNGSTYNTAMAPSHGQRQHIQKFRQNLDMWFLMYISMQTNTVG